MTTMPGNDHAEAVPHTPDDSEALVLAVMALAFEQRTANLIAAQAHMSDDAAEYLWVDHITPRLGIEGDDDE